MIRTMGAQMYMEMAVIVMLGLIVGNLMTVILILWLCVASVEEE